MHLAGSDLILSATDLSGFLACQHLTTLERAKAFGGPEPPKFDDPGADVLRQRGHEHEAAILEAYRALGLKVGEPQQPDWEEGKAGGWARCAAETLEFMRAGVDIVYQACVFDGQWLGRPDFLIRVECPTSLRRWSYEVVDAKLARSAKVGAVLQICFYSEMLEAVQGMAPERMHLALGGPRDEADGVESYRVADFAAYYRSVKSRFLDSISKQPYTYRNPALSAPSANGLPSATNSGERMTTYRSWPGSRGNSAPVSKSGASRPWRLWPNYPSRWSHALSP